MRFVRFVLFAAALLILGACVAAAPSPDQKAVNKSDLDRFVEPTNGSAYSQGSRPRLAPRPRPVIFGLAVLVIIVMGRHLSGMNNANRDDRVRRLETVKSLIVCELLHAQKTV